MSTKIEAIIPNPTEQIEGESFIQEALSFLNKANVPYLVKPSNNDVVKEYTIIIPSHIQGELNTYLLSLTS